MSEVPSSSYSMARADSSADAQPQQGPARLPSLPEAVAPEPDAVIVVEDRV